MVDFCVPALIYCCLTGLSSCKSYSTKLLSMPVEATTSPHGCRQMLVTAPACDENDATSLAPSKTLTSPVESPITARSPTQVLSTPDQVPATAVAEPISNVCTTSPESCEQITAPPSTPPTRTRFLLASGATNRAEAMTDLEVLDQSNVEISSAVAQVSGTARLRRVFDSLEIGQWCLRKSR